VVFQDSAAEGGPTIDFLEELAHPEKVEGGMPSDWFDATNAGCTALHPEK